MCAAKHQADCDKAESLESIWPQPRHSRLWKIQYARQSWQRLCVRKFYIIAKISIQSHFTLFHAPQHILTNISEISKHFGSDSTSGGIGFQFRQIKNDAKRQRACVASGGDPASLSFTSGGDGDGPHISVPSSSHLSRNLPYTRSRSTQLTFSQPPLSTFLKPQCIH